MRNWNLLILLVSENCLKQIRVHRGVGVGRLLTLKSTSLTVDFVIISSE